MTKGNAKICGWVASIGVIIIIPLFIRFHFKGASSGIIDAFALVSISLISVCLSLVVESKKDKVSIENIATAAYLNFIAVGYNTYELLVDKDRKPNA